MKMTSPSAINPFESLQTKSIGTRVHAITLLCVASLFPLTAWAHRTLVVNNTPNECGGTLYVSGEGWAKTGEMHISQTGVTDTKGAHEIATAPLKNGKFSATIPYTFEVPSAPPCYDTSVLVKITGAGPEEKNHVNNWVYMVNCPIIWSECPA
jgi:hypothetical protein